MTAITTFDEALAKMASQGFFIPHYPAGGTNGTSTGALAGFLNVMPSFNQIGTTVPGTLVGYPIPAADCLLSHASGLSGVQRGWVYGWMYRIGTLDLTGTGNKFTHDAATFPLLRTQMGQASQPITLMPFIWVTTALTTTAAVIRLRNVAGTTGYVDEDGNTVVGTKSITFPSATTNLNTGFLLPLEDTDYAIRDIQDIEVTTAAATGACTIFGFEAFAPIYQPTANVVAGCIDLLGETLACPELKSAAPTGGSLTSYFGQVHIAASGTAQGSQAQHIMGFKNT